MLFMEKIFLVTTVIEFDEPMPEGIVNFLQDFDWLIVIVGIYFPIIFLSYLFGKRLFFFLKNRLFPKKSINDL